MITKTITPMLKPSESPNGKPTNGKPSKKIKVVGTIIEYAIFGIIFYRKSLIMPSFYGITEHEYIIQL